MKNHKIYLIIISASILLFANSCAINKHAGENITKIEYAFGDASVAPKYHRSYVVTATKDDIRIVVNSYGNILADTTFTMNKRKFKVLTKKFTETEIKNINKTTDNHGCSGGTTKSFTITEGEKTVLNGTVYNCGGAKFGDLDGDVDSFSAAIIKYIPNIKTLLE